MRRTLAATGVIAALCSLVCSTSWANGQSSAPQGQPRPAATAPEPAESDALNAEPIRLPSCDGPITTVAVQGALALIGGNFSRCRDSAAKGWQERRNLALVDLSARSLVAAFSPVVDGQVRDVAFSADGQSVFCAGDFQRVNGVDAKHIARISLQTGEPELGFTARTDGRVTALAVSGENLVAGGEFARANDDQRAGVAMFSSSSGELRDWHPDVQGGVTDVVIHEGTQSVLAVGDFTKVAGRPSAGIAKLDARSGRRKYFAFEETLRRRGINARLGQLVAQGDSLYISAAADSRGFRGVAKVTAARGHTVWVNDCDDDVRGVDARGEHVVLVGVQNTCPAVHDLPHFSEVARPRMWAVQSAQSPYQRVNLFGDFVDTLASESVHWYPRFRDDLGKVVTPALSSVAIADEGVVAVGQLPAAVSSTEGELGVVYLFAQGAERSSPRAGFDRSVQMRPQISPQGGVVVASTRGLFDDDTSFIRYDLMRDGTNVASAMSVDNSWWSRANPTLVDTMPQAGRHEYSVLATTVDGQRKESPAVMISGMRSRPECRDVGAKHPSTIWMFAPPGTDVLGDCVRGKQLDTSVVSRSDQGWEFTGDQSQRLTALQATTLPSSFAFSISVKTTSSGVVLATHGSRRVGPSAVVDAGLLIDRDGRVGVFGGHRQQVVRTDEAFNDGQWHQIAAVVDRERLQIWVDGQSRVDVGRAAARHQGGRGYWRVGGDRLAAVSNLDPEQNFVGEVSHFGYWTGVFDPDRLQKISHNRHSDAG